MNCVFCAIREGKIPATMVYEDDEMIMFKDLDPKAAVHLLAVPKEHFATIEEANEAQVQIIARMIKKVADNKAQFGLENGYRLVVNAGRDGGQTIYHLHIHILGGQELIFEDLKTLTL